MADIGIFGAPFFVNVLLPFILVFVVVFAILEKTEILGKGKRQVNSITSFVFALITIALPAVSGVMVKLIPIVAIIIVILLTVLLILGLILGEELPKKLPSGLKILFGILVGLALIGAILWATGSFPYLKELAEKEWASQLWSTLMFLAFVIAIFAITLTSKPEKKE